MSEEIPTSSSGPISSQPADGIAAARAFESMDSAFDRIASRLYSLASMLVDEGEDSIRLVETALANVEVSTNSGSEEARRNSQLALATSAVELIAQRDPEGLEAPEDLERAVTCIEDDDLDAAAEAREDIERMIAGPERDRVRVWLESLPTNLRTIYVLRAVAGLNAAETADLLARHGGPMAAGWTSESVRELFRQGLCSLASQLIHATARD